MTSTHDESNGETSRETSSGDDVTDEIVEEGYERDPDDDPRLRGARAFADQKALLDATARVGTVLVALAALAWGLGVDGAKALTIGLALGCFAAVVNLALLARGIWALFEGRIVAALVLGGSSFTLLLALAFIIYIVDQQWLLGYGLGITIPAFAGVVYAKRFIR